MRLGELLDIAVVRKLAHANYEASGMPIGIIDAVDGSVLVGFGWQDICTMYHRVHPITVERCRESDQFINDRLTEGAPVEYTCRNGLRDIGVPIIVDGQHLATLFLGQFFYAGESPARGFFTEQAREFGFDQSAYLAALDRVPVFSRSVVENILVYNAALASFLSDLAEGSLRRRRAEARAESLARLPQESPEPVLRLDREFNVVYANPAASSALGGLGVAVGRRAPSVITELARRAAGEEQRVQGVVPAGDRFYSISVVAAGDDVNVYAHDITQRTRAEQELDAERMRWRGVVEGIAEELWVCDERGRMALINLPEKTAMLLKPFEDRSLGEVLEEVEILNPDGQPRAPDDAPLLRSLRRGEVVRGEEMMRHRKTGKLRHRQFSCAPMRDATGRITGAVAIVRDITRYKDIEKQLREANRAKDDFLGMLSHELRNPLAPIRNSLYILEHAEPAGQQARRAKDVAGRQLAQLTRLVDDLLDVSRIVRGKVELRRTDIDIAALARRTGEDHRAVMHQRGLDFAVETPDAPVWVDGDEARLTQVIGNLLLNAAKFTPAGGNVTLAVVVAEGTAELHVRDTGAGIEPDLLKDIFDPFVQAKQSLARTEGGLGLGLALVQGVVELHGGTVDASSEGKGCGAEFTVRLPLVVVRRRDHGDPVTRDHPTTARLRVLVVDDNQDAAESLADLVRLLGHQAELVFDGTAALEHVRADPPDTVLCDIGLPGLSGYEVAQALRSDPRFDQVQLVAVSGYAQPEDRQRALASGFADHISKPPDPAKLHRLLARSRPMPSHEAR